MEITERVSKITDAYKEFKGNAWEIAKNLSYEYELVEKILLEEGLLLMYECIQIDTKFSKYTSKQMYQFIEISNKYDNDVTKIINSLPFDMERPTIRKYLKKYKVIPPIEKGRRMGKWSPPENELSSIKISLILDSLSRNGGKVASTSRTLNVSHEKVKEIGIKKGILIKNKGTGRLELRVQYF